MIRIIIADDHAVVRRGLKEIVAEEADLTLVGEAQDAQTMLALVRQVGCDVVVTDISMPGRNGLDAMKELKQERPKLPVLVLSMYSDELYGVQALKLGSSGYLIKDCAAEELVQAIRKVVSGGRYVSASLAEKLASDLTHDTGRPAHESLSPRELQVLRILATGKSLTEIAEVFSLSVKTVSTYRNRILEKMGMKSNEQLIHYAISHGLPDRSMAGWCAPVSRHRDVPRHIPGPPSRIGGQMAELPVA